MSSVDQVETKCGAAPGPGCFGCYAHSICGSEDGVERDFATDNDGMDMGRGRY